MNKLMIALVALTAWTAQANGPDPNDVYFTGVNAAGNGCPAGSAAALLSPDRQELTISFDSFIAEAGVINGKRSDRKACTVMTGIHVPPGFSVSIIPVDFRGYNSLTRNSTSEFNVEYYLAGYPRGVRPAPVRFRGPLDREFNIRNELVLTALSWSRCGDSVNLNTLASVKVTAPDTRTAEATMQLDTMDLSAEVIYQLQWRRC